ncbi:MAG TPA: hypothetical protein VFW21_03020 [Mycobacterium sp.]|nr:hypothetical protein [Mycobacterium sp.]
MVDQPSRLQLLGELSRLDHEHTAAALLAGSAPQGFDRLLERYSYGELQVIADFLAADTVRLQGSGVR